MKEKERSCLIRTEASSITQEIPRDLEAVCQKPSQRPNHRTRDNLVLPASFRKLLGF